MKITFVVLGFWAMYGVCLAEGLNVKISDFLATAKKDYVIEYQEKKVDALSKSGTPSSPIEEMELRYDNEGFARHKYSLRFSPFSIREWKARKNVALSELKYNETKSSMLLNRALRSRYNLIIDHLYQTQKLSFVKELHTLFQDRINVLAEKSAQLDFDFNDLMEAEEDFTKTKDELIETEFKIKSLERKIEQYISAGDSLHFDSAGLIEVETLKKEINSNLFVLDTNNLYLTTQRLDLENSHKKLDLEKAETNKLFNFLELSYDHGEMEDQIQDRREGKAYDLNRSLSFQLGFNIPFVNQDKLSINRRQLNYLAEKGRYEDLKSELNQEIRNLQEEIRRDLKRIELLEMREKELNSEGSLKTYLQVEGIDPLILLRTREASIKSNMRKSEARFEIYKSYIKLMDITGKLSETPLKNYLSDNFEVIN